MIKSQLKKIVESIGHKEYKKAAPSEFVSWLSFANAGMLNAGNVYCIEYAVANLPSDSPVIEIGSFCGLSTNLISYYLRKNDRSNKLITCDKWIFEGAEVSDDFLQGSQIRHNEYRNFVKDSFIRNISFFSKANLPYTIEKFSDDFFEAWKSEKTETDVLGRQIRLGGKIAFAFIDGNHTYEFAKRDFENVDRYLEPGGFILFDDSADNSMWNDVNRLVKEILKGNSYEFIVSNPNYMLKKNR